MDALKKMALNDISEKQVFRATDLMNNRLGKRLGYKTLFEVFCQDDLVRTIF
ncbi:hypothetical protein BTHERMOSOX_977 [Bathymodiolus thermophilus thioautotrophic gill symbiont]|uniref:Uncharacterized protein n=1 Tax=Bathymodiolus thermophilus thioautotrophic gill symbiont TaxID=2360 RepID=A0A8H8XDC8_9GAMM|nr:hypothetical protein THERMOS_381 [Bathymodiolus thermophilus thioautotrophic gill symbiont]CAB5499482.1 hypothetical protein THERMOT_1053 [Bathymodiolus thermophilus thioautotrophic gill symbiont]SHA27738.1 hypothetical protein BTHERMOSOX_977 [Bathymodiolus thermophilus thioautotrophic gill symbiont]